VISTSSTSAAIVVLEYCINTILYYVPLSFESEDNYGNYICQLRNNVIVKSLKLGIVLVLSVKLLNVRVRALLCIISQQS